MIEEKYNHQLEKIAEHWGNDDLRAAIHLTMDFSRDYKGYNSNFLIKATHLKQQFVTYNKERYELLNADSFDLSDLNIQKEKLVKERKTISLAIKQILEEIDQDIRKYATNRKQQDFSENPEDENLTNLEWALRRHITREYKDDDFFEPDGSIFKNQKIVETVNLTKNIKGKRIRFNLNPISFDVNFGDIVALVGGNGSGKSTLLNLISGTISSTGGELNFPTLEKLNNYQCRQQIAYIPQELKPWQGTLYDNLHFTAATRGIRGNRNQVEVDFWVDRLGLREYLYETWQSLSGGYKMRFSLARALLTKPKLLLLDEPLANLDINTMQLFLNDLSDLAQSARYQIGVIVTSQHIYEIEQIANKIIFLREGNVIYNGDVSAISESKDSHVYEVSLLMEENELHDKTVDLKHDNIINNRHSYIIEVPSNITSSIFIEKIQEIDNGSTSYYRNISNSTRRLFIEENDEIVESGR